MFLSNIVRIQDAGKCLVSLYKSEKDLIDVQTENTRLKDIICNIVMVSRPEILIL